jgi:hypothetical protein
MRLIHRNKHYKLAGQDRIRVNADLHEVGERVARTKQIFSELVTQDNGRR